MQVATKALPAEFVFTFERRYGRCRERGLQAFFWRRIYSTVSGKGAMKAQCDRTAWKFFATAAAVVALLCEASMALAADGKIYVVREPGGVIRFTSKAPSSGEDAQIFTARAQGFSYYRSGKAKVIKGKKLYPDLYAQAIHDAARQHRIDPNLIKAVIHVESNFNARAVSRKGAKGLMQLMPGTARMLGVRNAFVPEWNIKGGAQYLATLLKRYGNEAHALAAYNAGDVPVQRYNGIPPFSETQEYVRRVLLLKKQYTAVAHG